MIARRPWWRQSNEVGTMATRYRFPGMDPWLEQHWGDVHQALVTYIRDALQGRLPGGLRARMQERVFVEAPDRAPRNIYPDVLVVEKGRREAGSVAEAGTAVAEPLVVRMRNEPITQT
jgi:hypothetical protein